jgi:uncharacterized protein with HEPN domain
MKDALRVPDYLEHIRDAIERVFRYVEGLDSASFFRNQMVQDAVIRNIEIIGEASRNIERVDPAFVARHAEIDFAAARAMRNAVAHGYHRVDLDILWLTVENDLSLMHTRVLEALHGFPEREKP